MADCPPCPSLSIDEWVKLPNSHCPLNCSGQCWRPLDFKKPIVCADARIGNLTGFLQNITNLENEFPFPHNIENNNKVESSTSFNMMMMTTMGIYILLLLVILLQIYLAFFRIPIRIHRRREQHVENLMDAPIINIQPSTSSPWSSCWRIRRPNQQHNHHQPMEQSTSSPRSSCWRIRRLNQQRNSLPLEQTFHYSPFWHGSLEQTGSVRREERQPTVRFWNKRRRQEQQQFIELETIQENAEAEHGFVDVDL